MRVYGRKSVEDRTGIEEHYRVAIMRELETYILPTFGECDVRSPEHFSQDTIRPWVRKLEQTMVSVGQEAADPARVVYAIHLDGAVRGFHKREDAVVTLEQWQLDTGLQGRLETWSWAGWQRMPGGQNVLHRRPPERVWVYNMGPTLYRPDGTEMVAADDAHAASGRWVWEWERTYTTEPAIPHAEWLPGEDACTEARAWGLDEKAVQAAYARARADALRICEHSPHRGLPVEEPLG